MTNTEYRKGQIVVIREGASGMYLTADFPGWGAHAGVAIDLDRRGPLAQQFHAVGPSVADIGALQMAAEK